MPERTEEVRKFLQGLLEAAGEEKGTVEVVPEEDRLYVNLRGPFHTFPTDPEFRDALAHVLRLFLRRHGERKGLLLDVNGKVKAREMELVSRARELAERALREGKRIELEPMPAAERRLIHLALADHPGVRTYSVGQGNRRHVVIEPRK
jgi:spoIIIJ-associated protein